MKHNEKSQEEFYKMFLEQLQDIYDAENQIISAFPKAIESAYSPELKKALNAHAGETRKQKTRLETAFKKLNEPAQRKACEGVKGLLAECNEVIASQEPSFVRDAALIMALQKVEHYEIATYGTLKAFAKLQKLHEVEDIFEEILNEEGNANKALSKVAEGTWLTTGINAKAVKS